MENEVVMENLDICKVEALLISLLEDQEGIKIEYTMEEKTA